MLNITKGKIDRALKVVAYGSEGIGKTTFAAAFPEPLFIDTEGGTAHMDVRRIDRPQSWEELISVVNEVAADPNVCKTLVLDTADWAETLCVTHVCQKYKQNSIESFGYGKGYTYLAEEFGRLFPIAEQDIVFRKLELPIAALVHSGGKSLHAIVRVDAENYEEYRKRVEFLYDFLEKNGVSIDKQNRNPSRLSRMPGVTRNGNRQYLIATNIGRKSWVDWLDFVEGVSDELPDMVFLDTFKDNPPELPEELITGILRRGHKMLISGSSKAGKSFLLMELCIAIAEGKSWLGFQCKKGRVLYVNLEIDPASAINRFLKIYDALGLPIKNADSIVIWNLRGHAVPLDQLVPKLIRRVRDQHFDAIIIDPIYKVITGDENNASEMGAFCNQFDKICTETGCSTIYCHHHSKGAQGMKKAMDRASGSGVFARDPDAQLDMIQLELSDDIANNVRDGSETAWRLESSLREFPNIKPVNFWFEYPIHKIDDKGTLGAMPAQGTPQAGRLRVYISV